MREGDEQIEHNRELLVLAYCARPSPDLLREILNAFDPICRSHAFKWARAFRGHPMHSAADLVQDARMLAIALLPKYKPRGGSFQRFLIRSLRSADLNKKRKIENERARFRDNSGAEI